MNAGASSTTGSSRRDFRSHARLVLDGPLLEAWLQCELRSWLEVHAAAEAAEPDGLQRLLAMQRAELLELLTSQEDSGSHGTSGRARTGRRPRRPSRVVGAAFQAPLADLLAALPAIEPEAVVRGSVDLVETTATGTSLVVLASGTRVREHHLRRLGLALVLAPSSGLGDVHAQVLTVDRSPSRRLAPARLLHVDVSDRAREEARRMPLRLTALAASLSSERPPATAIGPHCRRPHRCPFIARCWAPYRDRSIYQVAGLRATTRGALRSAGWVRIDDISAAAPGLTPAEATALRDAREGRVRIDRAGLQAFLATLAFPIAYLDLEFATPAVPLVAGMAPFEPLPFQFSVDLERLEGAVEHLEDLSTDLKTDPRPALAAKLATVLDQAGSIVVYDASSEQRLLAVLARASPAHAGALERARNRIWDLLAVLQQTVRHPGFAGRWDLKRVASVLTDVRYASFAVRDGLSAQTLWRKSLASRLPATERSLREYCAADSRAMLAIVQDLRKRALPMDDDAPPDAQPV